MQVSHLLGAGAAFAVFGWFLASPAQPTTPATPPVPTEPVGHYVLVVEGDRNALAITAASAKTDPWAGVPVGFTSAWRLRIQDGRGAVLADVPLDVGRFETDPNAPLRPVRVEGCLVKSAAIGMLVNVPAFAAAATYTFTRPGEQEQPVVLGAVAGDRVRALAGGGR